MPSSKLARTDFSKSQIRLALLKLLALCFRREGAIAFFGAALSCGLLLTWKWWRLCCTWKRCNFLKLSSPLYGSSIKLAIPNRSTSMADYWWGFCPCCKRPVDARISEQPPPSICASAARGKYAFVITIWGSSREYVLGAMVLGHSLKRTGSPHSRVCLHTDDVPEAYVNLLSTVWDCRLVEHVPRCDALTFQNSATRFEHVFTKLRVLELVEFEKVLLLDIDLIILSSIDQVFDLPAPAAMRRGMNDGYRRHQHGDWIDGRAFFQGCESKAYSWGQGTGINAGMMLLQPNAKVFEEMVYEIVDANHPSHIKGNGPEQDYLSRYWADTWTHISVEYNFQLHQMFFALQPERAISVERAFVLKSPEQIKVVHFSGNHERAKPWHRILNPKFADYWPGRSRDAEYTELYAGEFAGYWLWVKRDRDTWKKMEERRNWDAAQKSDWDKIGRLDVDVNGMYLGSDGEIYRHAQDGGDDEFVEIPQDVVKGSMTVLSNALSAWFDTFEDLQKELGFDIAADLGAKSAETAAQSNTPTKAESSFMDDTRPTASSGVVKPSVSSGVVKPSVSKLWWSKSNSGWWEEHDVKWATPEKTAAVIPKASACCSAVMPNRFVRFIECGACTYMEEDEDLRGIFVKLVGRHSARHFLGDSCNSSDEDALVSLDMWVSSVPNGEPVLLAIVGLTGEVLQRALVALSPLGVPPDNSPDTYQAFAAVGMRAATGQETKGFPWKACHASSDIAYAAMSLTRD